MFGIASPPGASIINPLNLPGLKAWWDFSKSTGFNGGACTGVVDLSGNANDLFSQSPNRPINKDNFVKSGKRIVYFPPVGAETDWLTVKTLTPTKIFCPNGYTAFLTIGTFSSNTTSANPNINPPNTYVGDVDGGGIFNNFGLSAGNVVYCYYDSAGAGWTSYSSTGQSINNGFLHTICVSHSTTGNINIYLDGINVNSSTSATTWSSLHGMSIVGIGNAYADQANDGNTCECLIFDASLSEKQIKQLHIRSRSVYGTQLYF